MLLRPLVTIALGATLLLGCQSQGAATVDDPDRSDTDDIVDTDDTDTDDTDDTDTGDTDDTDTGDTDTGDTDTGDAEVTAIAPTVELPDGTVVGEATHDSPPLLAGLANQDDDYGTGRPDWQDLDLHLDGGIFTIENDLTTFVVHPPVLATGTSEDRLELRLEGEVDRIRIWDDSGQVVLGEGAGTTFELADTTASQAFHVEFADWLVRGHLELVYEQPPGDEFATFGFDLMSGPVILNHHLQPSEQVQITIMPSWGGNAAMRDDMRAVLGDMFVEVPHTVVDWDVWFQDEIEFATYTSFDHRVDVVIDSVRDRGVHLWPPTVFDGADDIVRTWGSGSATTLDSFGNLEVSPPVTVDGIHYPFGRIYHGGRGSWTMKQELIDFLEAQKIQAPFMIDSAWLCVAHVDEWQTFIPDPTAPKGFRFLYSDIDLFLEVLEGHESTYLTRYAPSTGGHGISTVGGMTQHSGHVAYNEDLRDDFMEPQLEVMKQELGLDEEDILRIPAFFEDVGPPWCSGYAAALMPGMANLLVATGEDGNPHLFIPDPFMRTDLDDQDSDPIIAWWRENMPSHLGLHFVDNWDVYHMNLGEVHCGTNAIRTPHTTDWWDHLHLME